MVCVAFVRRVLVECCCLKPCCSGERGRSGLILERISFSMSLDMVDRRDMGLYDSGRFGGLFGFRIGTMWAVFHVTGILLCNHEKLKMAVSAVTACGPRCFRW